jgi:hypothetical protein
LLGAGGRVTLGWCVTTGSDAAAKTAGVFACASGLGRTVRRQISGSMTCRLSWADTGAGVEFKTDAQSDEAATEHANWRSLAGKPWKTSAAAISHRQAALAFRPANQCVSIVTAAPTASPASGHTNDIAGAGQNVS